MISDSVKTRSARTQMLQAASIALVLLAPSSSAAAHQAQTNGERKVDADSSPFSAKAATDVTGTGSRWQYYQEIELPADSANQYCDFFVPPEVFDKARYETTGVSLYLGDLRLVDAAGREVPYALRVRRPTDRREPLPASEFNRTTTLGGASQSIFDLGAGGAEHNEVVVSLDGENYRRHAVLEGSADSEKWETMLDTQLVFFRQNGKEFDGRTLTYPRSRFRYLRLRVDPDSEVDRMPPAIQSVVVRRTVTVPGEIVSLPATIESREPARANGGPASAWILDVGVSHVPCEKLTVEVADQDFARDYTLEAGGAEGSDEAFAFLINGQWVRSAGQPQKPLDADFAEHAPGRLRLIVTDFRNPPLELRSAQFSAPARQVVFARDPTLESPLRLYYGNHKAEAPHYDLERNLPARLDPPPVRLTLQEQQENPNFAPEPKPFTERWPWLIYAVLGVASVVLGLVLLDLGRTALAEHDRAAGGG